MRTTVNLPDDLLGAAKQLAAARRVALARVLEESLRAYLAHARDRESESSTLPPLPIVRGVRTVRGIDLDDTSALLGIG